ncbi:MAG: hypothetical protein ABSG64_09485 [Solirubrobacteraceae bacterium]
MKGASKADDASSTESGANASPATEPAAQPAPAPGTPTDLQQAYDTTALSATAGYGDTVAIVDAYDDPAAESDLAQFRSYYGLPPCTTANGCFTKVGQTGSTTSLPPTQNHGWTTEISLDLDAVSSLCPNCHLLLVEADSASDSDLVAAEHAAADTPGVDQISNSWMSNGSVGTLSDSDFSYSGIATLAAAGDSGWDGGDTNTAWPAALNGVNAVGGTDLNTSTTLRGFTETAWSGSGSGCADETKPVWQTDTVAGDCTGRSYNDISADADPYTGIYIYDSDYGGFSLWGGTSLATPLTAAYYALLEDGAGDGNASWNYSNADVLGDVTSGNNSAGATCAPSYLCNAGAGYDGPTGNGSISGDAVVGAPGIGAADESNGYLESQTATTATLVAGIYTNGLASSYYLEYGPTTSYGQTTASQSISAASSISEVEIDLTGLPEGVNEHYRLVATNADGTVYGYDYNLDGASPRPPSVDGLGTSNLSITDDSATVSAAINPEAWASTYYFAIGTSPSDLSTHVPTEAATIGSEISDQSVSQTLTGLTAGTTYYVEAVATNTAGTTTSMYESFTTAGTAPGAQAASTGAGASFADPLQAITAITPSPDADESLTALTGLADAASIAGEEDVCAPNSGHAACAAQLLVDKSTGAAIPARVNIADSTDCGDIDASPAVLGAPAYFQQAYDTTALSATAGSGSTIAIVDAYGYADAAADLATYRSCFDLPPANLQIVNEYGSASDLPADPTGDNTGWELEQALDLDAVSSICPLCHIILVQADSSSDSDLIAAEQAAAASGADVISNSWSTDGEGAIGTASDFVFPGVATTAAAGDFGYLPNPPFVDYPAAYADVTAVGGTDLYAATTPDARGIDEVADPGDSSGCSSEAKPSWQLDTGCAGRVYNDISADGGVPTGLFFYDPGLYSGLGSYEAGGSSLATALTAGYLGVLHSEGDNAGEGSPSWAYSASAALNPVLSGSNDNVNGSCAAPDLYLCTAGPGYNGPAGNGTISGDAVAGAPGIAGPARSSPNQVDNIGSYEASSTPTTITLDGGVYPNQLDTEYWVQYGPEGDGSCSYSESTAPVDVGSGLGAIAVSTTITDLVNGERYCYRFAAANIDGTSYGYEYTMSPLAAVPPVIDGYDAFNLDIEPTGADIGADVESNQFDTSVHFLYGTSPSGMSSMSASADAGDSASTASAYVDVTGLSPGTTYYVEAVASNIAGTTTAPTWESFTTPSAPVSTAAPVVVGTAEDSYTLSVSTGSWSGYPTPTFAYQWQRCGSGPCADISEALASSYIATSADVGSTLRALVVASNAYGSITVYSAPTSVIEGPPEGGVGTAPTLSASDGAVVGSVLTASEGTWTDAPAPSSYSYKWQRSCAGGAYGDISEATSSTYILVAADVGCVVRVQVKASNRYGASTQVSAASATVSAAAPTGSTGGTGQTGPGGQTGPTGQTGGVKAPTSVVAPVITVKSGVLRATTGTWTGAGSDVITYSFQWQQRGSVRAGTREAEGKSTSDIAHEGKRAAAHYVFENIGGATRASLKTDTLRVGTVVRVLVRARDAGGTSTRCSASLTINHARH